MLAVALTGGIGSGKTAVTALFSKIACQSENFQCLKIIDADTIARELLSGSLQDSSSSALEAVHHLFGSKLFNSAGELDRTQLRSLIFSSKTKKQQLEALLHPLVYKEIFSKIKALTQHAPDTIVIIAIPLLFETKSEDKFDRVLVIDAPVELQISRSTQRDNCSTSLVKNIIDSQIDRTIRLRHADDIIDNSGTLIQLQSKVEDLFQYYCSLVHKS